jgi:hypothetical protein
MYYDSSLIVGLRMIKQHAKVHIDEIQQKGERK